MNSTVWMNPLASRKSSCACSLPRRVLFTFTKTASFLKFETFTVNKRELRSGAFKKPSVWVLVPVAYRYCSVQAPGFGLVRSGRVWTGASTEERISRGSSQPREAPSHWGSLRSRKATRHGETNDLNVTRRRVTDIIWIIWIMTSVEELVSYREWIWAPWCAKPGGPSASTRWAAGRRSRRCWWAVGRTLWLWTCSPTRCCCCPSGKGTATGGLP